MMENIVLILFVVGIAFTYYYVSSNKDEYEKIHKEYMNRKK